MLNFERKDVPMFPDAIMYVAVNGYYSYTILHERGGYSATYKGWRPLTTAQWVGGDGEDRLYPDLEAAIAACEQIDLLNQHQTLQS